jgi:hypothetical protein
MKKQEVWLGIALACVIAAVFFAWQDYRYTARLASGDRYVGVVPGVVPASLPLTASFPLPEHTRYEMTVAFNAADRMLTGHSLIYGRNTAGSALTDIPLQCYPNAFRTSVATPAPPESYPEGFSPGGIDISLAEINGAAAAISAAEEVTVWLHPETAILPGEAFSIRLEWQVLIPQAKYRFGLYGDTVALGHFYPSLTYYDASGWHTAYNSKVGDPFCLVSADYAVAVAVPPGYTVAAGGTLSAGEDGSRWYTASQLRDFPLCIMKRYLQTSVQTGPVTIHTYYPLGGHQPDVRRIAAIVSYYSALFGPYRLPAFQAVYLPMEGFDGMEYDGFILMREDYVTADVPNADFILAHEIAHQWWYGAVGSDQLKYPWLDEGLANWSAYHYLHDTQQAGLPLAGPPVRINRELRSFSGRGDYYATTYTQGANFWFALERRIGTEQVLAALQLYVESYTHRLAQPEDLLRCIQAVTDQPLNNFFTAWLQ